MPLFCSSWFLRCWCSRCLSVSGVMISARRSADAGILSGSLWLWLSRAALLRFCSGWRVSPSGRLSCWRCSVLLSSAGGGGAGAAGGSISQDTEWLYCTISHGYICMVRHCHIAQKAVLFSLFLLHSERCFLVNSSCNSAFHVVYSY